MNYLVERCLLQTFFLSIIMQQDEETTFTRLVTLYALGDSEQTKLQNILRNEIFQKLTSSAAVTLHENFILSFCADENEFGRKEAELGALESKRNAYALFENFESQMNNFHDTLFVTANKNDKLSVTLALLYFLSDAKSELFLPLLRRAEGHGNAEATILLMFFESERKTSLFEKLLSNKELLLTNDDTLLMLANHYGLENDFEYVKGVKVND